MSTPTSPSSASPPSPPASSRAGLRRVRPALRIGTRQPPSIVRAPGVTLYAQIEDWLAGQIAVGALAPGDRLPTEQDLAGWFGVSRMTLRHALAELAQRGLVTRTVGRHGGTVVAAPKLEQDLTTLAGFSEQLRRHGMVAGARVLSAGLLPAGPAARSALRLADGDEVYEVRRIRLADGRPIVLERSLFPATCSAAAGLRVHVGWVRLPGRGTTARSAELLFEKRGRSGAVGWERAPCRVRRMASGEDRGQVGQVVEGVGDAGGLDDAVGVDGDGEREAADGQGAGDLVGGLGHGAQAGRDAEPGRAVGAGHDDELAGQGGQAGVGGVGGGAELGG
jgi:DNA-binding transcriptional regulator YhcF (GntR family)